jgi:apolipoprotein N-acyltransferase
VTAAAERSAQEKPALLVRLRLPGACIASGFLMFLSAPFWDLWPLAWFALVPTLWAIRKASTPRRAFFLGWLTGFVANAGGFYWIGGLLQRFGHMPFIGALPLFVLLVGYQGLLYGIWAYVVRRLGDRYPITLVAPVTMAALELAYWMIFPWYYALTQAWVTPIIQVAEIGGPIAVSFLLVLMNGAIYDVITERKWRRLAIAGGVVAASLVFGFIRIAQVRSARAAAPKLKVGIVQPNFGILEGRRRALAPSELRVEREMSASLERRGAQLIVWPESAYPYAYGREQLSDWADERTVSRGLHTHMIVGALTLGRDSPYPFNSALLIRPGGAIGGRFDKVYLLLFGEYIPFYEDIKWFKQIFPEASNLARGKEVTTFDVNGFKVAPMICYEDIIPSFGRRLAAMNPQLLVNITNDAWFGRTSEPHEHLALAVFRTVEHRLDLVRAVNTGVSAFVDATGKVVEKGPSVDPEEVLDPPRTELLQEVAMMPRPTGLYGKIGDLFGWLNFAGVVAMIGVARFRRKDR